MRLILTKLETERRAALGIDQQRRRTRPIQHQWKSLLCRRARNRKHLRYRRVQNPF